MNKKQIFESEWTTKFFLNEEEANKALQAEIPHIELDCDLFEIIETKIMMIGGIYGPPEGYYGYIKYKYTSRDYKERPLTMEEKTMKDRQKLIQEIKELKKLRPVFNEEVRVLTEEEARKLLAEAEEHHDNLINTLKEAANTLYEDFYDCIDDAKGRPQPTVELAWAILNLIEEYDKNN